jgi:hypothetical protein
LSQTAHALPSSGQDFVGIGLVSDIPNQTIVWRIEDIVQGDGQLYHPEPSGQMTASAGDRLDEKSSHLSRQRSELGLIELTQIPRQLDLIKQWISFQWVSALVRTDPI